MLINKIKIGLLTIAMVFVIPAVTLADDNAITISAGGAAGGGGAAVTLMVEYERALTSNFAIAARTAYLDYTYDDGDYEEDGNGPGIQVSAKFYPGRDALNGFYVGGGIGFWQMDVDWVDDKGTGWESSDSLSTSTAEIHAEVGWRIGDKIQFNPSIQVGTFLSSELEMAEFLSLNLGLSFKF